MGRIKFTMSKYDSYAKRVENRRHLFKMNVARRLNASAEYFFVQKFHHKLLPYS